MTIDPKRPSSDELKKSKELTSELNIATVFE
jgi:hypothetical protein